MKRTVIFCILCGSSSNN